MQRNRSELKGFFKKGAIPTESNFADLIESVVVQQEDSLLKPATDPLTLRALGSEERVLLFARGEQNTDRVTWLLSHRPPGSARPGLGISEPAGTRESETGQVGIEREGVHRAPHLRFFIESETGQVGIGINQPTARLHVAGPVKIEQKHFLELGAGLAKEPNAGRIGYQTFSDALDIVGAGPNTPARKIRLWSEGGTTVVGPMSVGTGTAPGSTLDVHSNVATHGGWLEAIRFTRPEHSAITHPGGGLLFGLHGNRNFYFADVQGGFQKYVMVVNAPNGRVGIGIDTPRVTLDVIGVANVSNGHSVAAVRGFMAAGSLTIGDIESNYGGGRGWSPNTAGLMLEAAASTEIAVHDSGNRLTSLMFYSGDAANRIIIGRDMGWGAVASVGIANENPSGRLDVAGLVRLSFDEHGSGPRSISFAREAGDEPNAGKIAYRPGWDPNVLGIVGAGPAGAPRKVRIWDDVHVDGKLNVGGAIVGSNGDNQFSWNGAADVVMRCPSRGKGGRALVADGGNTLTINYAGDFTGGCVVNGFRLGSSRELKDGITALDLSKALEVLRGLSPVFFHYRGDPDKRANAGFIAEESPDLVTTSDKKAIGLSDIVAVLTKTVQAQQAMLEQMAAKLGVTSPSRRGASGKATA